MANAVSPSKTKFMSDGQIAKAKELLEAGLRKANLPFEAAQQVVTGPQSKQLQTELVAVVRRFVEVKAKEIVRRVKVDRTIEPQAMLDALGRNQYTDKKVVATMPRGEGEEVDFVFFKPEPEEYTSPGYMSDVDLARALDRRGLTRDPYAQAQANKDDPAFADERPNGTHWKDGDVYNFAAFSRWDGGRHVDVRRSHGGWDGRWWFGGVRK